MKADTKCIHEGYKPGNGDPLVMPIYQSTTYTYDSTEHIGDLFDMKTDGHIYSRISNPSVAFVEDKIAAMDGGIAAVCVSSGQMASMMALLNIMGAGDHFVSSSKIYGGTVNLFAFTLKKLGVECTLVDQDASEEEIQKAFRPNTKALFGESLANPALSVLDIEKFARIAHKNNVPLIIDNTFPTAVLCRPFEHGADIIVYSTTKYMDGHATVVGGAIVDSGNFDWSSGKFPELITPDESYHGLIYTQRYGKAAYAAKLRLQLVRDFGVCPPAMSAFLLNQGLQTLGVRMKKHSENAMKVAQFMACSDKVESVSYPGLDSDKHYALAQKYMPDGCSGVVSITVKGGKEAAIRFMDSLKLASNVVHVATVQTCVLHPASETHRQLTDDQLIGAGINPGMIRLSIGIEDIEDILADFSLGLESI